MTKGRVILAGAGIGPTDFVTERVRKEIDRCDVIIHDRLLNEGLIPKDSDKEIYFAGKKAALHYLTQDETNELMVKKAEEGKRVLRLKGGDPYVFGRGGEEAEYLLDRGIEFEVLPGVTSGIVSLMYAGIPATHRDASTSVSFITGNRKEGTENSFREYATVPGTLVFYMGLNNLPSIVDDLIAGGMSPERPCAVIMHGGYPDQKVQVSTLENICSDIEGKGFGSPSLIVVGEVVRYRERLNFYEGLPLFGRRVVLTRALSQSSVMRQRLEELGAIVTEAPCIEIEDVPGEDFIEVLKNFSSEDFTHVVLHSVNGARIFLDNFLKYNDIRALSTVKICVTGKMTARIFTDRGIRPDIIPEEYYGSEIKKEIGREKEQSGDRRLRILLPHSDLTADSLLQGYRELGELKEFTVYRNTVPEDKVDIVSPDYVLFTSSSTVDNFISLYGKEILEDSTVVSIGRMTTEALGRNGLKADIISKEATLDSMIEAVMEDNRK